MPNHLGAEPLLNKQLLPITYYPRGSTSHPRHERRKSEPQVGKFAVVKEGPNLYQEIEERPSHGPEILTPQDRQCARYYQPKMLDGGGDS